MSYVYAAAHAGTTSAKGWQTYEQWAQWLWEGNVAQVIAALEVQQGERGETARCAPQCVVCNG